MSVRIIRGKVPITIELKDTDLPHSDHDTDSKRYVIDPDKNFSDLIKIKKIKMKKVSFIATET